MTTVKAFFLQISALFSNFWKRAGETSPLPPSSYAPVWGDFLQNQLYVSIMMGFYTKKLVIGGLI